jgi:hypothetical protein
MLAKTPIFSPNVLADIFLKSLHRSLEMRFSHPAD